MTNTGGLFADLGLASGSQGGSAPISIGKSRRRRSSAEASAADGQKMELATSDEDEDEDGDLRPMRRAENSENRAPSGGLEESWYVAPSACVARR